MKITLETPEVLKAVTAYLKSSGVKAPSITFEEGATYAVEVIVGEKATAPRKPRKAAKPKSVAQTEPEAPAASEKATETADDVAAEMEGKSAKRVFGNVG